MLWDVYNGVSRRGWAGGDKANWNLDQETQRNPQLTVTRINVADEALLDKVLGGKK
jgi:hypothetical protein